METQLFQQKGAQQLTTFVWMSIVAKRSPISATAELLLTKSMQHFNETQFSGFLFPPVVQKH